METIESLKQYYLFSHIKETPIYYHVYTKINKGVKYGGKIFIYNVSFKINKKNFNLKKSNPKLWYNKKIGDYEYTSQYINLFSLHSCFSISCSINHIKQLFKNYEEKIEECI